MTDLDQSPAFDILVKGNIFKTPSWSCVFNFTLFGKKEKEQEPIRLLVQTFRSKGASGSAAPTSVNRVGQQSQEGKRKPVTHSNQRRRCGPEVGTNRIKFPDAQRDEQQQERKYI